MAKSKYDILVFVGRFQPFHLGHKEVIDRALTLADRVLILCGSANITRSPRNPFTFEERKDMIERTYVKDTNAFERVQKHSFENRLIIRPMSDYETNEKWSTAVRQKVTDELLKIINSDTPHINLHGLNDAKVGLIGCEKDHTSFYLKLFPEWANERVDFVNPINATDIRDLYFNCHIRPTVSGIAKYIPDEVGDILGDFYDGVAYEWIRNESEFLTKYKENVHKFPRNENTVDSVVIQSGHVLLVQRGSAPGYGTWALPGGFLNPDERMFDGAVRELREETRLKVPEAVLRGSLHAEKTFDNPNRSERGRIITQVFLFKLPDQTTLPKVKGRSDAMDAKFVPIAELDPKNMFEDHYFLIQTMKDKVREDT